MLVQRIAGLKSDLLPNDLLHTRRWYYATPLWYYHGPGPRPRLNTDRTFYTLVDHDLRALCMVLHRHGLRTTPSCQGHFYPRRHYERVFEALRREESLIHTTGLPIFDAETGAGLVFQDARYRLPWDDCESLHAEAGQLRGKGYLGIWVPPKQAALRARLRRDAFATPEAAITESPRQTGHAVESLFRITVDAASPEERRRAWDAVTRYLSGVLEQLYAASFPAEPEQRFTPLPLAKEALDRCEEEIRLLRRAHG
jgi:hypothetical protein